MEEVLDGSIQGKLYCKGYTAPPLAAFFSHIILYIVFNVQYSSVADI